VAAEGPRPEAAAPPRVMSLQDAPKDFKVRRRASVSAETSAATITVQAPAKVVPKSDEARERIRVAIQASILFQGLEDEQEEAILDAMFEKQAAEGEVVIKEGDEGDNFYVIESGVFEATKGEKSLFTYEGKGSFGELALMYNCPRAATVSAKTAGVLWGVDRMTFRNIIVVSTMRKRLMYERTLSEMELFSSLMPEDRSAIADALVLEKYDAGETILKEGEELTTGAKFYIIESGRIEIHKTIRGVRKLVKSVEGGVYFGEMALIQKVPRAADCTAVEKSKVLSMHRDAFERLMGPVEEALGIGIGKYDQVNTRMAHRKSVMQAAASRPADDEDDA